jgi:hypothetical protein
MASNVVAAGSLQKTRRSPPSARPSASQDRHVPVPPAPSCARSERVCFSRSDATRSTRVRSSALIVSGELRAATESGMSLWAKTRHSRSKASVMSTFAAVQAIHVPSRMVTSSETIVLAEASCTQSKKVFFCLVAIFGKMS